MNVKDEMNSASSASNDVDMEYEDDDDVKEESDEYEDFEYESNEEIETELADGQYLNEQSPSKDDSDEDVKQVVIPEKTNSRKRSREEASTSGHKKKKEKASNHNAHEQNRRINESTLFEELAQEDDDEYDHEYENVDADNDNDLNLNMTQSNGYLVAQDVDDKESDNEEDDSNGLDMNSLRFCDPDGRPWKNEEEREAFFDRVASEAEKNEDSEAESEDSDPSENDEILEEHKDILKFFELHGPGENDSDENDPAEIERLQELSDGEELSEAAKEDARKTRILIQSVYTVATVFQKFPLSYALQLDKKVENIQRKCAEMRAALMANGFPKDKLPPTITNQK